MTYIRAIPLFNLAPSTPSTEDIYEEPTYTARYNREISRNPSEKSRTSGRNLASALFQSEQALANRGRGFNQGSIGRGRGNGRGSVRGSGRGRGFRPPASFNTQNLPQSNNSNYDHIRKRMEQQQQQNLIRKRNSNQNLQLVFKTRSFLSR